MADLETLAREWLREKSEASYDDHCDRMAFERDVVSLAVLLRSRDERALRIVEEVRENPPTIAREPTGGLTPPAYMATVNAVCDEIERRLKEVAGE